MIIGWFSFAGKPFVKARVIIPRLGVQREVEFLVDTGADRTCLNYRDAANMGLFPEILRGSEMTHAEGVGGGGRDISGKTRGSSSSTPTTGSPTDGRSDC